jgi:ATP-dependent Zn protease
MQKWVVELIVSWLPFIFLIGVWVWLGRRGSFGAGAKVVQLYEQQIDETRRTNVLLERIAVSLEKPRAPQ